MEHCIINQQIKPFASAAEAVGKCITSYDPSCLVATESARSTCLYASRHQPATGSPDRVFGWHPDRAPFGPTGKRFSPVVGGGKWPTNSLLSPHLNAWQPQLGASRARAPTHCSDPSIDLTRPEQKQKILAPVFYVSSSCPGRLLDVID